MFGSADVISIFDSLPKVKRETQVERKLGFIWIPCFQMQYLLRLHLLLPQSAISPRLFFSSRVVSKQMAWAATSMLILRSRLTVIMRNLVPFSFIQPSLRKTSTMLALRISEFHHHCYLCSSLKNRIKGKKSDWGRFLESIVFLTGFKLACSGENVLLTLILWILFIP